ncbi:MAG: hypothetical protein GEU80_14055 [Dehalococcoidia bacterium]|nr:hypothetical protein [Dehalococcoidia bacterium]
MSWLPDDIREASGGEVMDSLSQDAVKLAHRALERFPDLVKRHKYIAGGAALSSSLIVLAGVAVAQRMRRGQSAEDAVSSVTEQEVEGLVRLGDEDPLEAPAGEIVLRQGGASEPSIPVTPPLPVYTNGSRPSAQPNRDATASEH